MRQSNLRLKYGTDVNKLDPKEKADAIAILCGSNFDSVVQLLTRCSSLIHDLNANSNDFYS